MLNYFLHIEKTGGISLRNILENNYGPGELLKFYDRVPAKIAAFRERPPRERAGVKWVSGHFDFGIHREMGVRDYRYVTLLRDPVERMVSFYYYFIDNPSEFTTYGRDHRLGFEAYLHSGRHAHVDNGQTRRIAGVSGLPAGRCRETHLERAKENLTAHFTVVGILERFPETLLLLREESDLKNIFYLQANKAAGRPAREELPRQIVRVIEAYNQLDLELYRFSETLLEKKIKEKGQTFEKEIAAFKSRCRESEPVFDDFDRGLRLFREGKPDASGEWFHRVLSAAGRLPEAHEIITKSYFYLGEIDRDRDLEQSRSHYGKGIELLLGKEFKTEEEMYLTGSVLKRLGRYEKALDWFGRLAEVSVLKRFTSGACFHMGEIYREMGNLPEAAAMMRRTLELNPLHRKAAQYLEKWN